MKRLFYFAFMAMLCCGMTACDKDEKDGVTEVDLLLGSWSAVKEVWSEDGEQGVDEIPYGEFVLTFEEGGVGYATELWEDESYTEPFKYEVSGDWLRVGDDYDYQTTKIVKLTQEQLVLLEEGSDEFGSYRYESYFVRYK